MSQKRYATPSQIPDLYPGLFSIGSIRHMLFFRDKNGLGVCVKKLGKKILIDLDKFEEWIEKQ